MALHFYIYYNHVYMNDVFTKHQHQQFKTGLYFRALFSVTLLPRTVDYIQLSVKLTSSIAVLSTGLILLTYSNFNATVLKVIWWQGRSQGDKERPWKRTSLATSEEGVTRKHPTLMIRSGSSGIVVYPQQQLALTAPMSSQSKVR